MSQKPRTHHALHTRCIWNCITFKHKAYDMSRCTNSGVSNKKIHITKTQSINSSGYSAEQVPLDCRAMNHITNTFASTPNNKQQQMYLQKLIYANKGIQNPNEIETVYPVKIKKEEDPGDFYPEFTTGPKIETVSPFDNFESEFVNHERGVSTNSKAVSPLDNDTDSDDYLSEEEHFADSRNFSIPNQTNSKSTDDVDNLESSLPQEMSTDSHVSNSTDVEEVHNEELTSKKKYKRPTFGRGGPVSGLPTSNLSRRKFLTKALICPVPKCGHLIKIVNNSRESYNRHLLLVHQIHQYRCYAAKCTASFDKSEKLTNHQQTAHQGESYPCPHCRSVFANNHGLTTHLRFYHEKGQLQCLVNKCFAEFSTPRAVSQHLEQKHTTWYACTYPGCTNKYRQSGNLKVHLRRHEDEKRFVCAQCGQAFARNESLKKHERKHAGERPFRCTWPGCGLATAHDNILVGHVRKRHFNLPRTIKEQIKLGIVDNRNPRDYIKVVTKQ